ncbi:hypothetical protein, partial [Bacillus cereus]|uniref:hypothetical protein n=1 Tax=Bacillus cereus TaxID=1396 RepID=UPI0019D5099D
LTFTFRHDSRFSFNRTATKQHSKTHANIRFFKKLSKNFILFFKEVNNIFCHKKIYAREMYFSPFPHKIN